MIPKMIPKTAYRNIGGKWVKVTLIDPGEAEGSTDGRYGSLNTIGRTLKDARAASNAKWGKMKKRARQKK